MTSTTVSGCRVPRKPAQYIEARVHDQGDPWDTQWDMGLALVGAILALVTLSRWHDRQLRRLVMY